MGTLGGPRGFQTGNIIPLLSVTTRGEEDLREKRVKSLSGTISIRKLGVGGR